MKKLLGLLFLCICTYLVIEPTALIAFAAETAPSLGGSITGLVDAVRAGLIAPILIGIMRLVRTEFVEEWIGRIHPGIAPLLVLGLGLVAEVLTGTTEGKPWYAVALQGLTNGGVAMELYDTVGKHFLKKKTT